MSTADPDAYRHTQRGSALLFAVGGARVYIGSDEPERLLQAIQAARGGRRPRHPH
jgi:hypothetical protein